MYVLYSFLDYDIHNKCYIYINLMFFLLLLYFIIFEAFLKGVSKLYYDTCRIILQSKE